MKRGIVAFLVLALVIGGYFIENTGPRRARQKCENAVTKEFEDADKVLQQPTDLNAFCAQWNNHPPGISP